jgi:ABC-type nitrate/sulfonate/bicarbonate transport system substrate-binding protein
MVEFKVLEQLAIHNGRKSKMATVSETMNQANKTITIRQEKFMIQLNIKYKLFLFIIVVLLLFLGAGLSWGQSTKIRFSTVPFIGEAPFYVAYQKGFFKSEGLDITLKYNPGGWMSLKDLFEGRADIITVAELPIVYSAFDKKKFTDFEREDFYIVGDLIYSQQDIQQIVCRKDSGIETPADLKGKKIGVFKGTTLDYFMDLFFMDHRIKYSDVEIFNMNIPEMTKAISKGDVDAIFTWQPNVEIARQKLGDNAVVFQSRLKYSTSWLIIVMKDYAKKHPEILEKVTRAIVKAEKFIKKNPEESQIIHSKLSKTDIKTTKFLWNIVDFDLSLGEGLLRTLEGEAKWVIRKKMYPTIQMPDFMEYIYFDALEKVKPSGIHIDR